MENNDTIQYDTVQLERIKFMAMMYVAKEMINNFAIPPEVEVTNQFEWMLDNIVIRIRQDILGKQLDRVEIRYPEDWWQAIKARWFPKWALNRWPVIETIKVVDVKALYPTINIPGHRPVINVWQEEHNSRFYKDID
jgi:hypothetical protein